MDGSRNESGSRIKLLLISPEGYKITTTIRFKFKAPNNEADNEALIVGLWLASHLKAENIHIYSDSQLVVSQIKEEYQMRGKKRDFT